MEKIRLCNSGKIYKGTTDIINKNIIVIDFTDQIPKEEEFINGFEILNENNNFVQADYHNYSTIYRTYVDNPNKIELSNNMSIYSGGTFNNRFGRDRRYR